MDDDLGQLRTLFGLTEAFHRNVQTNFRLAVAGSLASILGVLALPLYKFWVVEILASCQFVAGVGIASRPLLGEREMPHSSKAGEFAQTDKNAPVVKTINSFPNN